MLPLASLLLVTNLQIGLDAARLDGRRDRSVHHSPQCVPGGVDRRLPVLCRAPTGVFMYWIPNSSFSLVQTALVRRIYPPAARPRRLRRSMCDEKGHCIGSSGCDGLGYFPLAPAPAAARGIAAPAPATNFGDGAISSRASGFASSAAGTTEVTAEEARAAHAPTAHPLEIETHVQLSKLLLRRSARQRRWTTYGPLCRVCHRSSQPRSASS